MDVRKTLKYDPTPAPSGGAPPPVDHFYLVVFERSSSRMVELPATGEVVIGRSDAAEVRLDDETVSRKHARIAVRGGAGGVQIVDLGSQNGTAVNGETIAGSRTLASGDVLTICAVTLVFHASRRAATSRSFLEAPQFHRRAEEEIDRSLRFGRPCAVVVLSLGQADRPVLGGRLQGELRLIDSAAWGGLDQILVLLPETEARDAPAAAERLLAVLTPVAPAARVGFATCPEDGCDPDTLIASARTAALEAASGDVASAADTVRAVRIGDRTVLVADPAMTRLYSLIERLAGSDLPVLVCGETGTGKEVAAQALHAWSPRRARPLVTINCAALQDSLVESELFGHDRGSFSGAVAAKPGQLELAAGGTVFLDEIGEMSHNAQAKLLRVIETKRVTRIGDVREREIDIRVVAATNRDLEAEVRAGRFRQDLFFRLTGAKLWIPPLRSRPREIPILCRAFLDEACGRLGRLPMAITPSAMMALSAHGWPGNVRELKNLMDYAAATVGDAVLEHPDVAERIGAAPPDAATVLPAVEAPAAAPRFRPIDDEIRELEKSRIAAALAASGGNQTRAADLISMPLRTLVTKLKAYGLRRREGGKS